jgi:hypothetical protein
MSIFSDDADGGIFGPETTEAPEPAPLFLGGSPRLEWQRHELVDSYGHLATIAQNAISVWEIYLWDRKDRVRLAEHISLIADEADVKSATEQLVAEEWRLA